MTHDADGAWNGRTSADIDRMTIAEIYMAIDDGKSVIASGNTVVGADTEANRQAWVNKRRSMTALEKLKESLLEM